MICTFLRRRFSIPLFSLWRLGGFTAWDEFWIPSGRARSRQAGICGTILLRYLDCSLVGRLCTRTSCGLNLCDGGISLGLESSIELSTYLMIRMFLNLLLPNPEL